MDGLGIGTKEAVNPLYRNEKAIPLAHFVNDDALVFMNGLMVRTDPRLGVEGRPQSASGQTTILTGINAAKLLGNHKQGFPNKILRKLITQKSVFLQLRNLDIGQNVFANAYTPKFFEEPPRWKSATTCAVEAADLPFRKLPDLLGRKAIFHDFTNQSLRANGFDIPLFSPSDCAKILAELSSNNRFTLYEHFITDKIGHDMDFERAAIHLPKLAEFICETLKLIDFEKTTFILTSDHGNIEDLSIRNHTLNDVPTIIWGRKKKEISQRINDLSDITPAILYLLTDE